MPSTGKTMPHYKQSILGIRITWVVFVISLLVSVRYTKAAVSKENVPSSEADIPAMEADIPTTTIADPPAMEADEEIFVRLYGDDDGSSGIWPQVRAIASDEEKLKNISYQAHTEAGMKTTDVIGTVSFGTKMMIFSSSRFKPIRVDTITYTVTRLPQHYLYICKGLGPDCAFYLIDVEENNEFILGMHVTNITFF